jgi:hypothetical protein
MADINQEINDIKQELSSISAKVDMVLELINNFTLFLYESDDDSDLEDDEDSDAYYIGQEEEDQDDLWENDNEDWLGR